MTTVNSRIAELAVSLTDTRPAANCLHRGWVTAGAPTRGQSEVTALGLDLLLRCGFSLAPRSSSALGAQVTRAGPERLPAVTHGFRSSLKITVLA